MHKVGNRSIVFFFVAFIFNGCSADNFPTVEVTRIIPQTVIATQIVKETIVYTQGSNSSFEIDPAYYDGILTVAQFYTYLGHGHYAEAYQLFSEEAKRPHTLEEYMQGASQAFKKVEIQAIHPYAYELLLQDATPWPSPANELRLVVHITAWGQGAMSGSVPSGQPQTLFISLVKENGEWKIDKFRTAPWRR